MLRSLKAILVVLCCANLLFAHGGGLDRNGGHMDHKTGTYHYHGGPAMPSPSSGLMSSGSSWRGFTDSDPSGNQRRARTEAKKKSEIATKAEKPIKPKPTRGDTVYRFHDIDLGPYQVTSFDDNKANWKCLLASGFRVNLAKERIIRIEAVVDPFDFRTWFDRSGEFSIVAKFVDKDEETVTLERMDERQIIVQISRLSEVDIDHLKKIDLANELPSLPNTR